jgi:hypothetical protein
MRPAFVGACVEEPRDVRMLEPGEDVPLGFESLHERGLQDPAVHHLDRHLPAERLVVTLGEIDDPHAARPSSAMIL